MIDVAKIRQLKGRRIYQFYLDEETGEITDVTSRDDIMIVRHGHWEDCSNGWMCSECKRDSQKETNYCPNCGAKMERWIQSKCMNCWDEAIDMALEALKREAEAEEKCDKVKE